jgi:hypothetical protein
LGAQDLSVARGAIRAAAFAVIAATAGADERTPAAEDSPIDYANVAAVLKALRDQSSTSFRVQQGWTVVASSERGHAVQWFFTPEGHPAHPSVIKRTALDEDGVGVIEVAALCEASQDDCDRLLADFRQSQAVEAPRVVRMSLDVGVALNERERVRVTRLVAEEGKAAEIRMDEAFKVVFVPTLDQNGAVTLWTAMYEFDGHDFVLVADPKLATLGAGTAELELDSMTGNRYAFSIASLPLARE